MAHPLEKKLDLLTTLNDDLKDEINKLREDLYAHDHGATYTTAEIRINASENNITGTPNSSTVTVNVPQDYYMQ